jgi:putative Mn2+ efflux pump MntP
MHDMPVPSELRRRTLILVASVVALDAVVIGIYYALHIQQRPIKTQETFVAVWVVLTLLVVVTQMKEIRKFRRPRG